MNINSNYLIKMRHWSLHYLRRLTQAHIRMFSQTSTMSKKIAVCQMTSVSEKLANLEVVGKLIGDAAKENVEMIFFPEACDYIAENKKDIVDLAEPIEGGNTVSKYKELAAKHNVWLSMGGLHEKDETNPSKIYNTHIIINNKGRIVQTYRKLHLFDVEIPERNIRLKESDFCSPGGHVVTPVETPIGKIGMAICYDMRFPELSTALSIMGAEILTFPSAFTVPTGQAHWHVLLRSRAIENQCYVIGAAQSGSHNAKRASYGHAVCIDPWGKVLADCDDSSPAFKVAEITTERLKEVRSNMPVFQHRRRDVYSLYTLSLRKKPLPTPSTSTPDTLPGTPSSDAPTPAIPCSCSTKKPDPSSGNKSAEFGNKNPESGNKSAGSGNKSAEPSSKVPESDSKYSVSVRNSVTNVFGHVRVPESCVFYKSKKSYAFVNLRCVIPGHVLVAPIRLAERNNDLTDDEAEDFFKTVRLVQKLMEKVHNTRSCTVTIQDGQDAGQTVKHLHCHIMPRKKGDFIENDLIYLELAKHDQFKSGHPAKPPRSLEEMQTEAEMLRKEIKTLLEETKAWN